MTIIPRELEVYTYLAAGAMLCVIAVASWNRPRDDFFRRNSVAVTLFLAGWMGGRVGGVELPGWAEVLEEFSQFLFFASLSLLTVLLIGSYIAHSLERSEKHRRQALWTGWQNKKLEEMNRFKTQLLNTASHELNTPISALRLQLYLLRDRLLTSGAPADRRAFEILDRNIGRLANLVKETLDVARIQSGTLALNRGSTSFRDLIHEALETTAPLAQKGGVSVEFEAPQDGFWLDADAQRLHQVVLNLLTNAIKFTPADGHVRLHLDRTSAEIQLSVTDSGIGLTPDQIGGLFKPFSQVHDVTRHAAGGTGLGLFISREIVKRHGGRVWAESAGPGRGSTFGLSLPAAELSAAASRPMAVPVPAS